MKNTMHTNSSAISVKHVHSAETSFVLTNLFSSNDSSSRSGGDLPENDGTNENTEQIVATNCDPLYFYYLNKDIPRTATPKSIITPKQNDVMIGKGYSIQNHPGNKYYHSLIEHTKPIYDSVSKNMKGAQAKMIVHQITQELNPPGRFLKENKVLGIWEEIERKVAVKKAWQALRDWKPRKLGAVHHRKAKKSPQSLKRKVSSLNRKVSLIIWCSYQYFVLIWQCTYYPYHRDTYLFSAFAIF